jgi:hypothetical protein
MVPFEDMHGLVLDNDRPFLSLFARKGEVVSGR